jgi:hypothetical protein
MIPQIAGDDLWTAVLLDGSAALASIRVTAVSAPWQITALTLVNETDGTFQPLVLGNYRLIHSGDVKIYENLDVLPRAFIVYEWLNRSSVSGAVSAMQTADFDPTQQAVIVGDGPERVLGQGESQVEIIVYEPERIELTADTTASGLLVLTEANFPGWQAAVNGQQVQIQQTNGLFQGVVVPPGRHTITFTFQSPTYQLGRILTLIALILFLTSLALTKKKFP